MKILSKPDYESLIASTRDARMDLWRDARFGMFIHFGLYSQYGHHEWAMTQENFPIEEYEKLANEFNPKPGAPREWAALAKAAGMKYMVLTSRHHEGFSLWDSKANPYNSVNYGPRRDIVREFVDACREYDLRIGFYTSLMDWHHPDAWKCAYDNEARRRFLDYIEALNTELLTNYGKIDILWYDVSLPMDHWEGWDSVARNQRLRALQPDIIINNRSRLDEDFGTPEEGIHAESRDWEACMTFNGLSWGYLDSEQVVPYSYNVQRIIRMLNSVAGGGGNLLLNIGPAPDGSVPKEAIKPLTDTGRWLAENGEALYGKGRGTIGTNGLCSGTVRGNIVYVWNWIWPKNGSMSLGGYRTKLKKASYLATGETIDFEQTTGRIILKNLPAEVPDKTAGITMLKLEFDEPPKQIFATYFPQLHGGREIDTVRD
jgi:alpha-L-fucosidase